MRIAAIDIGTNSTLLTVADTDGRTIKPVLERCEITRLGRGVSSTQSISEQGLASTLEAVRSYRADCTRLGVERLHATGTSAMRDAGNGAWALRAFAEAGVEVEIIAGEREAQLTYLSAARDFGGGGPLAVIDVGGGSTEVITGGGDAISWHRSFNVGVVRGREMFIRNDPPTGQEHALIYRWACSMFDPVPRVPGVGVVAVAGTPTTLMAVSRGVTDYRRSAVHGMKMTSGEIRGLFRTITSLPFSARLGIHGLEEKRADVIDAGALILLAAMQALGTEKITVSDGGVRWGLLWEMAGELTPRTARR
ncbi:MAG: Ppx/GppA family phosphatase [Myxococcota bacterium]|jgi:exopolyphosphatase/guanosine-5'-triphosphate,3'-diphosphate pyrophosphatase